jgi:hypothetical protein
MEKRKELNKMKYSQIICSIILLCSICILNAEITFNILSFSGKNDVYVTDVNSTDEFPYKHNLNEKTFDILSLTGNMDVYVRIADVNSVEIRTIEKERMDVLTAEIKGSKLIIDTNDEPGNLVIMNKRFKNGKGYRYKTKIQVYITMTDIKQIELSRSCNLFIITDNYEYTAIDPKQLNYSDLSVENITMNISGASSIKLANLNAKKVDIAMSGATRMQFNNTTSEALSIAISGYSQVNIGDIDIKKIILAVSGASSVNTENVRAESISITSSGASKIIIGDTIAKDIVINSSGASRMNAGNTITDDINIDARGASEFYFDDLNYTKSKFVMSGASKIETGK